MQPSTIPFNVSLLELTPQKLQGLKPVRVHDHFDASGVNFHEDGLFSTSIFGKVGDERRSLRFSFIDIKISIFHPVIYRALVSLKRLYGDIIAGKEYALWNAELKDFERSDPIAGQTGYFFFLEHWKDIEYTQTPSVRREQSILLLNKYKDKALTDKIIVMPAGLRDLEVGDDGRTQEDEINSLYRKVLAIANTISEAATKHNQEIVNTSRYRLQLTFNEIYETLENMIQGKKKLLLGKWGSRRVMNGTRNVISPMDTSVHYLGAAGTVGFNNTIMGLYQTLKSMLPVARYHVRNGFLQKVFPAVDQPAILVNKKTLKAESVSLKSHYFDRYATDEGVEKVITAFGEESIRHTPLEIEGRYVGLIYKGPDKTFRLLQDIDEVPETRSKADVHPLTFCELLYLSCYRVLNKYPVFITRYPIAGVGSIFPSKIYVKPTTNTETRRELDQNWVPMDDDHVAYVFPKAGPFINTIVPHGAKLEGLTADFDGDQCSSNVTYSDESVREVDDYLASKKAYVGTDGRFTSSTNISTVALVLHNLTGDE